VLNTSIRQLADADTGKEIKIHRELQLNSKKHYHGHTHKIITTIIDEYEKDDYC